MTILLNITKEELSSVSGDISYYKQILSLEGAGVEFRLVENATWLQRNLHKVYERLNWLLWPRPLRRWLLVRSRTVVIPGSCLHGVDVIFSHLLFPILKGPDSPPVVWSSQGISPEFYYERTSRFTQADVAELYNKLSSMATCALIWTESQARTVSELCDLACDMVVIPPIIQVKMGTGEETELPGSEADCRFLFVGREPGRKGLMSL